MKTNFIRISLIVLGVILTSLIALDSYIALVLFKLSNANFFEKWDIVQKYKVFDNLSLSAYSMILTVILLILMFGLLIKAFLFKTK